MALNASAIFHEGLISFSLYPYQKVLHPIIVLVGVPLNLAVAFLLLFDHKLHNSRNFIWMGIVVSNLIYFLLLPVEYFIFYEQSYLACQIVAVIAGKPYLILLINLFVATCDRFIYTKWPGFYQKHVTVKRILVVQLLCSAAVFLALTFPFWSGKVAVRCGVEPSNIKLTIAISVIFTLLCIAFKVAIYRSLVNKSRGIGSGRFVSRQIEVSDLPNYSHPSSTSVRETVSQNSNRIRLFTDVGSDRVRRMEQSAAMNFVIGLVPLCLFTLLSYLSVLCQAVCTAILGQCETLNSMEVYFRDLTLLHASTDLLVYICRSAEFRNSARRLFGRCQ